MTRTADRPRLETGELRPMGTGGPAARMDPPVPDAARLQLIERAKEAWKGQLVDLGGRNTLLYYRDLKVGTLDLGPGSGANEVQLDDLLSSRTVSLSDIFSHEKQPEAAKRARTIMAKAAENFEERGLRTLFLAWGMATWSSERTSATPAAPVLLRQAHIAPKGRAEESFDISLPGEWEVNPTLVYALRAEFGVTINADDLLGLLDEGGARAPHPPPVFEQLRKSAAEVPGISVVPRVVIGNFSYAKMTMVADLENGEDTLLGSDLICAFAGYEPAQQKLRDRNPAVLINEPDLVAPQDELLVLDADASQSYAINAVVAGGDLVVEGPPGTGKTQTIANLIATLAARGQRVLFVAEKRAAIDAVLDRLAKVGLADLVLDLQDGVGSKRKLAQDLARSLADASSLALPQLTGLQDTLVRRRAELVAHDRAMHTRRDPWGVSVYEILCRRQGVPETSRSSLSVNVGLLTGTAYDQARQDLRAYVTMGGNRLSPASSPWAGALVAGTVATAAQAETALSVATTLSGHIWPEASTSLNRLLVECGLQPPAGVGGWADLLELLRSVAALGATFELSVFQLPLDELAASLTPAGRPPGVAFAAITRSSYRSALRQMRAVSRPGAKHGPRALLAATREAAGLSERWRQRSTDGGPPRLPSDLAGAEGAYRHLLVKLEALAKFAALDDFEQVSGDVLTQRLAALAADKEALSKLPELTRLRSALARVGLGPLLDEVAARDLDVDQSLGDLDSEWLTSLLRHLQVSDPRVGAFERWAQDSDVTEFRGADQAHIGTGPQRVRRAVAERITAMRDQYPGQSELVTKQAALMRNQLPIRDLFEAAPDVLRALKPCWAMSPLVVSQLVPMRRCFDVVIFDEASQVTPAHAVGALARASRAVVAGDPHQLPPTSFFSASGGGVDEEEEPGTTFGVFSDVESVLAQMSALLPTTAGTRTLDWHYRSKDERLIAFSNAQSTLYNYSLTTFPGASGQDVITHVHVPFRPGRPGEEDSVSDEVARVVELVAEHARRHPAESLGVVAMGIKHANRVDEAIRQARRTNDVLDAFVTGQASAQARSEPFFVKNLERVQGDERDAIILTVGYGKTSDGRMLYRFGPLNNTGGERRLNVAITRARNRMTAVSSFTSVDLDPSRLSSEGAKMLARYLAYAENRGTNLGDVALSKPELNPFERDVEFQLTAAGIPLVAQWGSSGYRIDFAAKHPTEPGRMVLAIECDGVPYHSSATARDRERLRQDHLERLGWRFHRIWSVEWFGHREAEVARALDAYKTAVVATDGEGNSCSNGNGHGPSPAVMSPGLPMPPPARQGHIPVTEPGAHKRL